MSDETPWCFPGRDEDGIFVIDSKGRKIYLEPLKASIITKRWVEVISGQMVKESK